MSFRSSSSQTSSQMSLQSSCPSSGKPVGIEPACQADAHRQQLTYRAVA